MNPADPDTSQIWKAIDLYLVNAYDGEPPTVVRSLVSNLRSWSGPPLTAPAFAVVGTRRALRLGNRGYPHMKLLIEPSPDGQQYLFKADTHDKHICPASSSPEYQAFQQLMQSNQRISEQIESAWAEQGIPTFKTYLQQDLARRRAEADAASAPRAQ